MSQQDEPMISCAWFIINILPTRLETVTYHELDEPHSIGQIPDKRSHRRVAIGF